VDTTASPSSELRERILREALEMYERGYPHTDVAREALALTHDEPSANPVIAKILIYETRYGSCIGPIVSPRFNLEAWLQTPEREHARRLLGIEQVTIREVRWADAELGAPPPRTDPEPVVGLWVSYMEAGRRETEQVLEVIRSPSGPALEVRLVNGVIIDRDLLVVEGPQWWQTKESKLAHQAALKGARP